MPPEKPLPIADYALIGDCLTAALVGRNGSIDWLCLPHFDSSPCFAALLGDSRHGRWKIAPVREATVSRQYRDGTMVLETRFAAGGSEAVLIDFFVLGEASSHIVRLVRGVRGELAMRLELALRFDYGKTLPWVTRGEDGMGVTAIAGPDLVVLRSPVRLHGRDFTTTADFSVREGQELAFTMSHGASHLKLPAPIDPTAALADTEAKWQKFCKRSTYRGRYRKPVERSLLTLRALTYRPTGGIVAAPTTSLPEQIGGSRNWDYRFCWLRDATLTLFALMRAGYTDEALAWRDWLERSVAGAPDQIQIMYGLHGERRLDEWEVPWLPGYADSAPVRVGNGAAGQVQLDVYGEVLECLHQARRLDLKPAPHGWAMQNGIVSHLAEIWMQPDEGMWEVRGGPQNFTYSKVMAWAAVDRMIRDAEEFGLEGPVSQWRGLRQEIFDTVLRCGIDPERNCFVQSFGSREMDASLLLIPVTGFLPADDPRVLATLAAVEKELLEDGFVRRYRTEATPDGQSGEEGVFLACSFWLADAYAMAGRREEAAALFERLLGLRNDVGLLSEEYDPTGKRLVGNFPQAFSHVGLIGAAMQLERSGQALAGEHAKSVAAE